MVSAPAVSLLEVIDELPAGWTTRALKHVISDTTSGDWGQEQEGDGLVPVYAIRGTDFGRARRGALSSSPVRYLKASSIDRRQVRTGDLLVEMSGGSEDQPTGRILLVSPAMRADLPIAFSNFVKRLRVDTTTVEPTFFAEYWDFLYRAGRTRTYEKRTTGIRNFKLEDFIQNEQILLPPLEEQQLVVSVLRATKQAQAATERVIATTRELKSSLTRHLLTYGSVPIASAGTVPLKATEAGFMPDHWKAVPLGEVLTLVYRYPSYYGIKYQNDGVPEVRGELLGVNGEISADRSLFRFISRETADRFPRTSLELGDLVLSVRGTMGKVGLVPNWLTGANITANLIRLAPDRQLINSEFLKLVLLSEKFVANLGAASSQTTIKTITAPVLRSLVIPLPSRQEQDAIARILSLTEAKLSAEMRRGLALTFCFQATLSELMTCKRRVVRPEAG